MKKLWMLFGHLALVMGPGLVACTPTDACYTDIEAFCDLYIEIAPPGGGPTAEECIESQEAKEDGGCEDYAAYRECFCECLVLDDSQAGIDCLQDGEDCNDVGDCE